MFWCFDVSMIFQHSKAIWGSSKFGGCVDFIFVLEYQGMVLFKVGL